MCNKNKSNKDLISVVIPTFNRDYLIEKAICNVMEQTYENIEVIVVDDGSNDNTANVVKKINNPRLKYIYMEKNKGMCAARNEGFKAARGQFLACQDSDVLWDKTKLEKQHEFLTQNKYDMVFCRVSRGYEDGKMHTIPSEKFSLETDILKQLLMGNFIDSPTIFMKKEVWDLVKFDPKIRRLTDWDFAIRVIKSGFNIGYQAETLVTSYIMSDSTSLNVNTHNAFKVIYNKYKDDFDKTPEIKGNILRTLGNTIIEEDRLLANKYYRTSLRSHFTWEPIADIMVNKIKFYINLLNKKFKLFNQ